MNQPPCVTDRLTRHRTEPTPYDVLIDLTSGPAHRAAVAEARAICGRCPLAQMQACYKANRGEQWVRAIVGADLRHPPVTRATCGKPWGGKAHARHGERNCQPCKDAAAEEQRNKRPRRDVAVCGTDSGYYHHRRAKREEPCDACREAHRVMSALRVARKKAAA